MVYRRLLLTGVLTFGLILTGCGQKETKTDISYPMQERMEAMTELCSPELKRAETFAESLCVVTASVPQPDSSVGAEAAAVFSLDDHKVILEKNVFKRLYPASTTKVMTALVAIRYGNLQDVVTVGQETVITEQGASLCHIRPGETLTMEQLLYGLMMPSGNDAGAAIAVHMAGSIEGFADLMNQEARAVGATDTHFVNPHGLHDEDHYTTAYDLYLIFQEAMKEPVFRQIVGTGTYTAEYKDANGELKSQTWNNSNQFLTGQQPMPDGHR